MVKVSGPRDPNPVDIHVGGRVRVRRKLLGMSQDQLAAALGLTFQQVQKYERGSNRISASKLYVIAHTLGAPVTYFFDGLASPTNDDEGELGPRDNESEVMSFLITPEGLELARLFPKIGPGRVRRQVVDLVRAMADPKQEGLKSRARSLQPPDLPFRLR